MYRLYERFVSEGKFESTLESLYEIGRSSGWQMKQDLEEVLLDEQVGEEDILEVRNPELFDRMGPHQLTYVVHHVMSSRSL